MENDAVNAIRSENHWTWIGLNDIAQEGKFVWSDGTPNNYSNFHPNEPNSHGGRENCVNMFDIGWDLKWNDFPCNKDTSPHPLVTGTSYICKKGNAYSYNH